jgi:hypothetical protein
MPIPTVTDHRNRAKHLDHLNDRVESVIAAMRAGAVLQRVYRANSTVVWTLGAPTRKCRRHSRRRHSLVKGFLYAASFRVT